MRPVHAYNWIPILLIWLYRFTLSPLLGKFCRFLPTCSQYGEICFQKFGFFKALWLTLWRIVRCQPFCRGGYDPPPDP